jgi:hypothetical protein
MSHAVVRKEILLDRGVLSHYHFNVESWIIEKLGVQSYERGNTEFETKLKQGTEDGVLIIIDWLDACMYGLQFYWLVQYVYPRGTKFFRIRIDGERPLDALRHLVDKFVELKKMSRDIAEHVVIELEQKGYFVLPDGVSLKKLLSSSPTVTPR